MSEDCMQIRRSCQCMHSNRSVVLIRAENGRKSLVAYSIIGRLFRRSIREGINDFFERLIKGL